MKRIVAINDEKKALKAKGDWKTNTENAKHLGDSRKKKKPKQDDDELVKLLEEAFKEDKQ